MSEKRVAVVTGAARGIGRCVVLELLKQGREVVGIDLNVEQLSELDKVVKDTGFSCKTYCVDITKSDEFKEKHKNEIAQKFCSKDCRAIDGGEKNPLHPTVFLLSAEGAI